MNVKLVLPNDHLASIGDVYKLGNSTLCLLTLNKPGYVTFVVLETGARWGEPTAVGNVGMLTKSELCEVTGGHLAEFVGKLKIEK